LEQEEVGMTYPVLSIYTDCAPILELDKTQVQLVFLDLVSTGSNRGESQSD